MVNTLKKHKCSSMLLALAGFFGLPSAVLAAGQCDYAVPVEINTTTGLLTLDAGAHDFYKIQAPSTGLLTLFTLGGLNTFGQLYDKDCMPINGAYDYDGGPDYNFLISWNVAKGPYYLEVRGANSSTQGAYKLQVDGDFASDDHGVSCSSATVVRDSVEAGALKPYGDRDYFQVRVSGGSGHLIVQTEGGLNTFGQLYDQDCLLINGAYDYDGGPDYNFKIDKFLSPGVYFVEVRGQSKSENGNYNLSVSGDVVFPKGACAGKAVTLSGTNGDDVIRGTAGSDVIQTFGGNDVVFGLGGNDIICGGDGDDVLQGGDGNDKVFGDAGNDVLQGGNDADTVNGGIGTDLCDGGAQTDSAVACEVKNLVP